MKPLLSKLYSLRLTAVLAARSIVRNFRRTYATVAAVAVGTLTMIFLSSYINTMDSGLKAEAISKEFGHFQVAAQGYFEADQNSFEHVIPKEEGDALFEKVMAMEEVAYVNKRVHLNGMIGNQSTSLFFAAVAGLPDMENMMAPTLVEGTMLSAADPHGVIIGRAMAKKLGVKTGDALVAFVSTPYGSQEAILVTIRGIYSSMMVEVEKVVIYMPIEAAHNLTLDESLHRVLVFLNSGDDLEASINEVREFVASEGFELEVRDWESLAVFVKQVIAMFSGMSLVVFVILFLVITFNVRNTIHISIHERFREIGALRALGAGRGQIIGSFMAEGFFIGLLGVSTAALAAIILIPLINSAGITLPPGPGQEEPIPLIFTHSTAIYGRAMIINLLLALAASYPPARRGAHTPIIETLRYV